MRQLNYIINFDVIVIIILMQFNQREITLQKIIKSQEHKIKEMEEQLQSNSGSEKLKLESILKETQLKLQSKQKELQAKERELLNKQKQCQNLMNQINKYRTENRENKEILMLSRESKERQKQGLMLENRHLIGKIRELQQKLKNEVERSETDINKILKLNQNLAKQVNFYKNNQHAIEIQIQKLQIFYRNALSELPRRTETLQWVENLIKFINKYEQTIEKHPLHNQIERIKQQLQSCNNEFKERSNQLMEHSEQKANELKKCKEEIQSIVTSNLKIHQEIIKENTEFWELIKKQRSSKTSENERKIQQELKNVKMHTDKQIAELSKKLKQTETEKKQMFLAIQQLKMYFESREKSYKEQIKLLKKSEQKLIQYGESREKIFEREMNKLTQQVDEVTRRYEQNIRIPFEQYHQKFQIEVKKMVEQISDLSYKDKLNSILARLDAKSKQTQNFIKRISQKEHVGLDAVQKNLVYLDNIEKNLNQNIKLLVDTIQNYGDSAGYLNQSDNYFESRLQTLQHQEAEQKRNYQINIMKKNYSKLIDINNKLQEKIEGKITMSQSTEGTLSRKNVEIENQRNALLELKQKYEKKFTAEIRKLKFAKYDQQIISLIAQNIKNFESNLQQLKRYNKQSLMPIFEMQKLKQQEYLTDIRQTIKSIEQFVENPIRRIQSIVKSRIKIDVPPRPSTSRTKHQSVELNMNFSEQIQKYKEIVHSRAENGQQIYKTLNELIVKIKTNIPHKQVKLEDNIEQRSGKKSKTQIYIDKRIRDIQAARLKQRAEISLVLEKVNNMIKKLQTTKFKSQRYFDGLNRIEAFLKQKIDFIISLLENPAKEKRFNELNLITKKAIVDLESKLKESIYENEGLVKELKLVNNVNKLEKLPSQ